MVSESPGSSCERQAAHQYNFRFGEYQDHILQMLYCLDEGNPSSLGWLIRLGGMLESEPLQFGHWRCRRDRLVQLRPEILRCLPVLFLARDSYHSASIALGNDRRQRFLSP